MLVISDTSPLRYLAVIGQPELLATLFGEVLAPGEVIAELSKSGTPDVVRTMIEQRPAWLRVRDPAPDMLAAVSAEWILANVRQSHWRSNCMLSCF